MSGDLNLQDDGQPPARTSKLAIASLVTSLLCFFFPVAFILSLVALIRCNKSDGRLKGSVLAIVALCLSVVSVVMVIPMTAAIAIPSLLRSRMAANSSAAIASLKTLAMAEETYRRSDFDGDGVMEYAQTIGELGAQEYVDKSLVLADAGAGTPMPKAGYCFRILTGLAGGTPGAPKDFMQGGNLVGGYAVVAYPVKYDQTGRDTFIILNTGTVYQQDLGPGTESIVSQWTHVNMDANWIPTE